MAFATVLNYFPPRIEFNVLPSSRGGGQRVTGESMSAADWPTWDPGGSIPWNSWGVGLGARTDNHSGRAGRRAAFETTSPSRASRRNRRFRLGFCFQRSRRRTLFRVRFNYDPTMGAYATILPMAVLFGSCTETRM